MNLIAQGIDQGFIKFDDEEKKYITYIHNDKDFVQMAEVISALKQQYTGE